MKRAAGSSLDEIVDLEQPERIHFLLVDMVHRDGGHGFVKI